MTDFAGDCPTCKGNRTITVAVYRGGSATVPALDGPGLTEVMTFTKAVVPCPDCVPPPAGTPERGENA